MTPAITVVVPAYNEAGLLAESLGEIVEGLRSRGRPFEVVIVENGSGDGTLALARELAAVDPEVTVKSLGRADYGEALRTGILCANGAVVVIFDADYYDFAFLDRALELLEGPSPPALVVGSKRAPGTRDDRSLPRRLITATFAGLLRLGFGLRVSDTHGMKAMNRQLVEPIARRCRTGRDLFDTELVLRADRGGLRVAELPVTVVERRPSRTPITGRALRTGFGLVVLRVLLWREGSPPMRRSR